MLPPPPPPLYLGYKQLCVHVSGVDVRLAAVLTHLHMYQRPKSLLLHKHLRVFMGIAGKKPVIMSLREDILKRS